MESTVKQRLLEFLRYKNISQAKFTQQLGLSNGYVNNIRKGISNDVLLNIAKHFPELNRDWLLFGEGEMLKTGTLQYASNVFGSIQQISGKTAECSSCVEKDKEISVLKDKLFELCLEKDKEISALKDRIIQLQEKLMEK